MIRFRESGLVWRRKTIGAENAWRRVKARNRNRGRGHKFPRRCPFSELPIPFPSEGTLLESPAWRHRRFQALILRESLPTYVSYSWRRLHQTPIATTNTWCERIKIWKKWFWRRWLYSVGVEENSTMFLRRAPIEVEGRVKRVHGFGVDTTISSAKSQTAFTFVLYIVFIWWCVSIIIFGYIINLRIH